MAHLAVVEDAWVPLGPVGGEADVGSPGADAPEARLAAAARCETPPSSASDLASERMRQRTLTTQAAVSLGIPLGTLSAEGRSEHFVLEHSRTAECSAPDGTRVLYGVAVRLVVEFTTTDVDVKAGLPSIAAAVELGYTRANVTLDVIGYPPGVPAEFILDWEPISVDSYAKILDKVNGLRRHVFADTANLRPERLGVVADPPPGAEETESAIGHLWAITRIVDGSSCEAAMRELQEVTASERTRAAAAAVYGDLVGDDGCTSRRPDAVARARAEVALGRFRLKRVGMFG